MLLILLEPVHLITFYYWDKNIKKNLRMQRFDMVVISSSRGSLVQQVK